MVECEYKIYRYCTYYANSENPFIFFIFYMHSIALNIVESLAPFCQIGFYDLPQPSSSLELGEYIIKTPWKITGWNLKITTNWKIIWTKPPFLGSSRYREFSRLYSKSITKCLHNTFFKSQKIGISGRVCSASCYEIWIFNISTYLHISTYMI